MDLTTNYLGLPLRSPLIPSASPMSDSLDNIRRMEDAGAGAIVLYSLFEEQVRFERLGIHPGHRHLHDPYPDLLAYFPDPDQFHAGPDAYLEHIAAARQAVNIPIIASLNGSTRGGWISYAKQIEQAGASALELNIYHIPTDLEMSSQEVEGLYTDIVQAVRYEVAIPLAVKLSPYFTNVGFIAKQFDQLGINGLVLFNRFYQADIDIENQIVTPNLLLSTPMALRLPLRWIAILYARLGASLAATGGIHRSSDIIKMIMAGADVTMLCSVLIRHGIEHLTTLQSELCEWLEAHGHDSLSSVRGAMSHLNCPDPSAYERAQYARSIANRAA